MPRRNSTSNRRVRVTREVFALAAVAAHRAAQQEQGEFLPDRVMGSRRISRRMLKALKAQVV